MRRNLARRWRSCGCVAACALLLAAGGCGKGTGSVSGKVTYKGTPVTSGAVTFHGEGGWVQSAWISPDGTFMVDTQYAPLTDKIVAAIKKVSSGPIRFIVDTHVHGDHRWKRELRQTRRRPVLARSASRAPGPAGRQRRACARRRATGRDL